MMQLAQSREAANLHYWRDGEYFQSWYAVCLGEDLQPGEIKGLDFLGTRIIVYRDPDGRPVAQTGFCPHLGADLALGNLTAEGVRCPYHQWEFSRAGKCTDVPGLNKPPAVARLGNYPAHESWGIIWVFNGTEALFPPPTLLGVNEDEVLYKAVLRDHDQEVDSWIPASNSVDFQHLVTVHGFPASITDQQLAVDKFSLSYRFNLFGREGQAKLFGHNSFSMNNLTPFPVDHWSLNTSYSPRPGVTRALFVAAIRKPDDDVELAKAEATLEQWVAVTEQVYKEDEPILNTARFRRKGQARLVAYDASLSKFFDFIDELPRAAPLD